MNTEKLGTINGVDIYVDSGVDQIKELFDRVNELVKRKKLEEGQSFVLPLDYDGTNTLIAEIKIHKWINK